MTAYTPSSSPPFVHSPLSHATSLPANRQHDPATLTARKVDLELLRLKGLGKVTKKYDNDDRKKAFSTTEILQHSATVNNGSHSELSNDTLDQQVSIEIVNQQLELEQYRHQLEASQQQVHSLKEELNTKYQQLEHQSQQEIVKYQTQLVQQEKLAHDTIADYMEKFESSQVNVRKLSLLVEKQDQLIEYLMDEHEQRRQRQRDDGHNQKHKLPNDEVTADWHSLYLEKRQLDSAIGSLKASMETNQAHMQMMMMVSTEIQNDFERQKAIMEQQLSDMADELAAKDILLQRYHEQQQQQQHTQQANAYTSSPTLASSTQPQSPPQKSTLTKSSASYRPTINEAVVLNSDVSPYPSLVSSSSSSRSSSSGSGLSYHPSLPYSASPSPPPLHFSTTSLVASTPSSPPPTIPLPPIPPQLSSVPTTAIPNTPKQQQQQQQQYPHYQHKQLQHDSLAMVSIDTIGFGGAVKKGNAKLSQPRAGSSDENNHHGKPFWKSMKTKWRNS